MSDVNSDKIDELADFLVKNDEDFNRELVKLREDSGMSVEDMAGHTGWSVQQVKDFESYWYDPELTEITLYALVLNVVVDYEVTPGFYNE